MIHFLPYIASILALVLTTAPAMAYMLPDGVLRVTRALPGSAGTVTSGPIDTGKRTRLGVFPGNVEFTLTAPALTTSQLADADTITYDILTSASADFSAPTVLIPSAIVQTGAAGAGAAGKTYTLREPSGVLQYLGFRAVANGSGDASAAIATLDAKF